MKLLIITNLFPNSVEPTRGLFNFQQVRGLAKLCDVTVVAPVPWAPAIRLPREERVEGIRVFHPRYLVVPVLSRPLNALSLFLGLRGLVRRLVRQSRPDAILATWAYPDVVASVGIAAQLGVPVVAKVHGSDLNVLAQGRLRRRMIAGALRRCAAVVAVSSGLKQRVVEMGVPAERVSVLPNGVDGQRFRPLDRSACRRQLGLPTEQPLVLFVGHLANVKGVDVLVEAFARCRTNGLSATLVLVGEGELRQPIERRVRALGLSRDVMLTGPRPHEEISTWLGACDLLCLPSRHEGCPNIVLEALACGRPVVGSSVGGVPELLRDSAAGLLVPPGDVEALAKGLEEGLARSWDARAIRQAAGTGGWDQNAERLAELLRGKAAPMKSPTPPSRNGMPIVYFGNDWSAENRTSSHHIALRLAARFPLLYVESPGLRAPKATARDAGKLFRKLARTFESPAQLAPQMWHITLPQVPFRGVPGVGTVNARFGAARVRAAMRALGFERPISWFTVPHAGVLAGALGERLTVYYCIDDYSALPDVDRAQVGRLDERLSRAADLVFASSPALVEAKRALNRRVVLSPHGVDVDLFRQAHDRSIPVAEPLRQLRHPVVGLFGLIDGRLDLALLKALARSRPSWSFLFIGHVDGHMRQLAELPNVMLPGPVPYDALPNWARAFDVCLMPYRPGPFAERANPLKLREYLACGKPVVSIPMPSVEPFRGLVSLASTPQEFLSRIETELAGDSDAARRQRMAAVADMSWEARVAEVVETVEWHMAQRNAHAAGDILRGAATSR